MRTRTGGETEPTAVAQWRVAQIASVCGVRCRDQGGICESAVANSGVRGESAWVSSALPCASPGRVRAGVIVLPCAPPSLPGLPACWGSIGVGAFLLFSPAVCASQLQGVRSTHAGAGGNSGTHAQLQVASSLCAAAQCATLVLAPRSPAVLWRWASVFEPRPRPRVGTRGEGQGRKGSASAAATLEQRESALG